MSRLSALAPLVLLACSRSSEDAVSTIDWTLAPAAVRTAVVTGRIGEGPTSEHTFVRITGLAVDSNGGVVVSDGGTHEVRSFDPSGRERYRVGRRGEGPGEYELPGFIRFDDLERLWVVSLVDSRVSVYRLGESVEHVATIPMRRPGAIAGAPIFRGDTILLPVHPSGPPEDFGWLYAYRSIDWSGRELGLQPLPHRPVPDSAEATGLVEIPRPGRTPVRFFGFEPFAAYVATALGPHGHYARLMTSRYEIEVLDASLEPVMILRVDAEPPPISSLERDSAEASLDRYRDLAREQNGHYEHPEIGTHKPVVRRIWFDSENRLWVERHLEHDPPSREADVYTFDGRPLFRAHWPVNVSLVLGAARDSLLAGVEWDALGVQRPVWLRLRPSSEGGLPSDCC